jgi:hypothetical protein
MVGSESDVHSLNKHEYRLISLMSDDVFQQQFKFLGSLNADGPNGPTALLALERAAFNVCLRSRVNKTTIGCLVKVSVNQTF